MRRIGVFAAGEIGKFVVRRLVEHEPDSLRALVFDVGDFLDDLCDLPAVCDARRWKQDDEEVTFDWLASRNLDLIFLAWWPYLIRGRILSAAPVILNTHPSLLPYCRGKDPNFWAIVECAPFGVTLHHVNHRIDAGEIAFQREISVSWLDTGKSLYQRALVEMKKLIEEALPTIVNGAIPSTAQGAGGSLHYRRELEPASVIDLDEPTTARALLNLLRARTFEPHPACRFFDSGDTYEVRVNIRRAS